MDIKRRGRKEKYKNHQERKDIRRINNRMYKRKSREKDKLKKEINSVKEEDFNSKYQNGIITHHENYDYDYFFTGTIAPKKIKEDFNQTDKIIFEEFDQFDNRLAPCHYWSIEALRSYTENYLEFLWTINPFKRCFVTYETDLSGNYHVHMLFKSSPNHINFNLVSENTWLIGQQKLTIPLEEKRKTLGYMVKQLKPLSNNRNDQKKIDHWMVVGEY